MLKRLIILLLLGCLPLELALSAPAQSTEFMKAPTPDELTLYIGTYTQGEQGGICGARFNPQTGELGAAQTLVSTPNASFLVASADGRFLYAVNESGKVANENKGGLSSFAIDASTGNLTPLNSLAEGGTLCHIAMDASGKWLVTAAYSSGQVASWPVRTDGSIGPRASVSQHTGNGPHQRQKEAHAHQVVLSPDNRRVFSADLGVDKVVVDDFNAETGTLTPASSIPLAAGAGPRHLALSPSGQFLYVVSELNNTITVFKDALGTPQQIQVVPTLPADFTGQSFTAEIAVSPNGRFLYASNRGHNSIACYSIETNGELRLAGFAATGGNPRHFTFDPTGKWLLVGNQNDRTISVFGIDAQRGVRTLNQTLTNVPDAPVCLVFVKKSPQRTQ